MSTALITSTDDYYAALAAEAQSYTGGGGGKMFLKFNGNDGYYSYGSDDTDLEVDTQAVMDPESFKRGYVCWKGGKVQEEIMLSLFDGKPPAPHLLPDHGPYGPDDGWSDQKTIELTPIEGDATGRTLLFQANNKSKSRALEGVMKDFARQYKNNPGMVPVISMGSTSFETTPKDGGRKVKKHAPEFKIVGWITKDEFQSYSEGDPADYEQAITGQAAAPALAAPVAEPEPAPVAETPKRGGRREAPASAGAPRAANAAVVTEAAPVVETPAVAAKVEAPVVEAAPAAAPAAAPRGRRF